MKYQKNYLGFNSNLESIINEKLKLLNKSLKEIINNNKELANIKQLSFSFDDTIEDNKNGLVVSGSLRSGAQFAVPYFKTVIEEDVAISDAEISSYYSEAKRDEIAEFLNDNYGILDSNILQKHEPILFNQLYQDKLLDMTPNTEFGLAVFPEDLDFFIRIAKET